MDVTNLIFKKYTERRIHIISRFYIYFIYIKIYVLYIVYILKYMFYIYSVLCIYWIFK